VRAAGAVASAIRALLSAPRTVWTGTASDLLVALEQVAGERVAKSKGWPVSAKSLGRGLRRQATFLRKIGIEIERVRDSHTKDRERLIKITRRPLPDREGEEMSEMSNRPKPSKNNGFGSDVSSDNCRPSDELSEETSEENPNEINASDNSDNSDNKFPTQSGSLDDGPVCQRCGGSEGAVMPCGHDGSAGLFHLPCWAGERTQGPLRKPPPAPEGDSLDDLV